MSNRQQIVDRLIEAGVVAIIRTSSPDPVIPAARALLAGGVQAVEVTLTTPGACEAIQALRAELGPEALIGVGTVLNDSDAQRALDAGACYVISPICRPSLVRVAHDRGCPVMLGCYTPTEAQLAHEAGADFIKLFPADTLGPAYIKALLAPLPHLRIVPTGGVNHETLASFIQAGCVAVGAGSCLVSKDIVARRAWDELTQRARRFMEALRAARGQ
ncbi:MAG: bifunctional 4-hydroxy-2-oxoglutarate aldolase/2-dehydro-3-deoxy-phosphogluconate aldolase [Verrucomicrobia bacterium]|nr:MAG: bifunctional 4-hydroxy-2-oxoglutarate aldolase/2-dehydro-3-deoxy-phosphogluconate aldolase [Verrucomicrobiota bacterium]